MVHEVVVRSIFVLFASGNDVPCIFSSCRVSLYGGRVDDERRPLSISCFSSMFRFLSIWRLGPRFLFFPISPSVLRAVLCGSRSFQTSHINLHFSGLWLWFLFASHPPFTAQGLDPDKCVRTIRRYYSLSYEHTYISIRVSLGGSKIYAPQIRCRGDPLAYRTKS